MQSAKITARRWDSDLQEVVELLRWLAEQGEIATLEDAIRVADEPWHYAVEYAAMCQVRAAEALAEMRS